MGEKHAKNEDREKDPMVQDPIKEDPIEYFGAEPGEEPGPRFVDAGDEEKDRRDDDFGEGMTAVG